MADLAKVVAALEDVATLIQEFKSIEFSEDLEWTSSVNTGLPVADVVKACFVKFIVQGGASFLGVDEDGDVIPVIVDEVGNTLGIDGDILQSPWTPAAKSGGAARIERIIRRPSVVGPVHQAILEKFRTKLDPAIVGGGSAPAKTRSLTDERIFLRPQLDLEIFYVDDNGNEVSVHQSEVVDRDIADGDPMADWGRVLVVTPLLAYDGEKPPQRKLRVTVTIEVSLDGVEPRVVPLGPFDVPTVILPLPSFLLLATEEKFEIVEADGASNPLDDTETAFWFVAPPSGDETNLDSRANEATRFAFDVVQEVVQTAGDGVAPAALGLVDLLEFAAPVLGAIQTVQNVDSKAGDCSDLNKWGLPNFAGEDANDEIDALMLFATPGREVKLYCAPDYELDEGSLVLTASHPVGITVVESLITTTPRSFPVEFVEVTDADTDNFHDSLSSLKWL